MENSGNLEWNMVCRIQTVQNLIRDFFDERNHLRNGD